MFDPLFIGCALLAIFLIVMGAIFVKLGSKKKENGKNDMALIIIGWVLIVLTVAASIAGFIIYIDIHGGFSGTVLFTLISPLFIFAGFVTCLGIGISALVGGYRRNEEGKRNNGMIVRGWSLLSLSLAIVTVTVITLVVLFSNHADARGDTPVAFM